MMKINSSFLILFAVLFLTSFSSCNLFCDKASGNLKEKSFEIEFFNELEISGKANVTFVISDRSELKIKADDNFLPLIELNQDDTNLSIDLDQCLRGLSDVEVVISTTDINEIKLSGDISFRGQNKIATEKLTLKTDGSSSMVLNLDTRDLKTRISGSGDITLKGFAEEHDLEISGAGSLDAFQLHTKETDVDVSGAGSAKVHVSEKLEGSVSGSGDLIYTGKPDETDTKVSGSGTIKVR